MSYTLTRLAGSSRSHACPTELALIVADGNRPITINQQPLDFPAVEITFTTPVNRLPFLWLFRSYTFFCFCIMPPKRKQTPDMPQSPPKRITRARAKKDVDVKPGTTRITTASAKASVSRNPAPVSARNSTRAATQLAKEVEDEPEEDVETNQPVAEAPKTRGKVKASSSKATVSSVTPNSASQPRNAPAKSTRSRSIKTATTSDQAKQLPKTRGRPKSNAEVDAPIPSETAAEDANEDQKPVPPVKVTRGRPTASAATKATTTRTRAAAAAPKKRVKFDEELGQGKENQPIRTETEKKAETKATGLRAKPIRKPAAAKGGARATKGARQEVEDESSTTNPDVLPLSPKKVTQVAKTPSVGSEDELAGDKTPLRPLNKSPMKIPMSVNHDADITVSRLEFAPKDAPQSPAKSTSPSRLASSPRKPPPSPFKDALKASPRKIDLGSRVAPPKFDAPPSPTKSPLKEAPKRVNLGDSSMNPVLQWSKTPLKSSLMKSPARRPGGSSMKTPSAISPSKVLAGVPRVDATTASKQANTFNLPNLSNESAASSPLRAAKSPEHQFRVHDAIKERDLAARASTPATSPAKVSEIAAFDEVPERAASEVISDSEDTFHLMADRVEMSVEPLANAVRMDGPSPIDTDSHSGAAPKEDETSMHEHIVVDLNQSTSTQEDGENDTIPVAPPAFAARPAFVLASPMIASRTDDSESEDELSSPQKLISSPPLQDFGISAKDFGTPSMVAVPDVSASIAPVHRASLRGHKRKSIAMTPLAMQMSSWLASSPEKKSGAQAGYKRGIFSPARQQSSPAALAFGSPAKPSFFEDEMAARAADDAALDVEEGSTDELQGDGKDELLHFEASQDSQASEVYGDENAIPEDMIHKGKQETEDYTLTCTPAKVFDRNPREIHTVSKVPLRPAADDTPLAVPRKRSRSLAGPLSDISMPAVLSLSRDSILSPILQDKNLSMGMLSADSPGPNTPETPTAGSEPTMSTPGRSVRKAGFSNVLKGAVVHVDVHTTEGADASGIFVDLLTQMGARCVKQWHWNPQASEASPQINGTPETDNVPCKVGITHVVYKDGGKRTLEKVREAKGAVSCVGVGWVLEYVFPVVWCTQLH